MSSVRDRIMAALRGFSRPVSPYAVARRLGYEKSERWVPDRLEELVAEGAVEKCGGCETCGAGTKYIVKDK